MARSFGRLFPSLWDDEHFRARSVTAKLVYGFLVSQADLEHSGIIPFRVPRWAHDLGVPAEDLLAAITELDETRYVVTDEQAGELLVRSLIRRDEIWRQPNVFKSAAASVRASKSAAIKAALLGEIRRLELEGASRDVRAIRDDLLAHLEPFANPSPTPPEPSPDRDTGAVENAETGRTGSIQESAGQNPSRTLPEPLANHSAGPTVKVSGNGLAVEEPFTLSLTPSPPPPAARALEHIQSPMLFAMPGVQAGEGGRKRELTRDQLAAAIRRERPDWSTASIERALSDPSVAERPWPLVCAAALIVARDPESKHAGRLAHDGYWWPQAATQLGTASAGPRPPWCGQCSDAVKRQRERPDGKIERCPDCHPAARKETA